MAEPAWCARGTRVGVEVVWSGCTHVSTCICPQVVTVAGLGCWPAFAGLAAARSGAPAPPARVDDASDVAPDRTAWARTRASFVLRCTERFWPKAPIRRQTTIKNAMPPGPGTCEPWSVGGEKKGLKDVKGPRCHHFSERPGRLCVARILLSC